MLSDIADLAVNPTVVRRVTAATVTAAVAIGNETYDGSQYRIARRALATQVLKQADDWGAVFAWAVAANPSITVASPDTDIEWTISSVWDAIAGAYQQSPTEPPTESPTEPA